MALLRPPLPLKLLHFGNLLLQLFLEKLYAGQVRHLAPPSSKGRLRDALRVHPHFQNFRFDFVFSLGLFNV